MTDSRLIGCTQPCNPLHIHRAGVVRSLCAYGTMLTSRYGLQVAEMLRDARADDVTVLDVRPRQCDFTDEIVIATARSKLHCQTAAQAVVYRVRPPSFSPFHVPLRHGACWMACLTAAALVQLKQACKEIAPGIPPRIEGMGTSHHANSEWLVIASHVIAHVLHL